MRTKLIIGIAITYIVITILTYGMILAEAQKHFSDVANGLCEKDRRGSAVIALMSPISFIPVLILTDFAQQGLLFECAEYKDCIGLVDWESRNTSNEVYSNKQTLTFYAGKE